MRFAPAGPNFKQQHLPVYPSIIAQITKKVNRLTQELLTKLMICDSMKAQDALFPEENKGVDFMSFASGTAKWVLEPGVVAKSCPKRTAEEWLEILQAKSYDLGRPISWMEIKRDPELDHHAIRALLGPYSQFEDKLLPGVKTPGRAYTRGCHKTRPHYVLD